MNPYDKNNVFSRLLKGEIPGSIVYEDEGVLAFHDVRPHAPVHVLIIPKGEFISFSDFMLRASPERISDFMKAVQQVAHLLNVEETGYRLIVNQGSHGGQEVPHFHVHLLGGAPLGPLPVHS